MDHSPPGSSVHGILQARILEWVAMLSSRGSSWPRDQTCVSCVSCIVRGALYHEAFPGHLGSPNDTDEPIYRAGIETQIYIRILEWVAYLFSRESFWPRNWTGVSCTAGGFFTSWATREAAKEKLLVGQLCPTLHGPMDYSPPGSSVHGIL